MIIKEYTQTRRCIYLQVIKIFSIKIPNYLNTKKTGYFLYEQRHFNSYNMVTKYFIAKTECKTERL